MEHSADILDKIIRQSVNQFKGYKIEPCWITIDHDQHLVSRNEILPEVKQVGSFNYKEVQKTIDLNNDLLILTSNQVDIPINSTLTLESLDNLFTITKAEYAIINYFRYQAFSNFLKISLKNYDAYVPFQLEFLKIMPTT